MKEKVLIVEDQFVEADYLRLMLARAGYQVCPIARSVAHAKEILDQEKPDIVLVDIFLKGKHTGIDLAKQLQRDRIAFVFLSANSNEEILSAAKATQPYGFLIKPFREKDLLITLEIAHYRHEHSIESRLLKEDLLEGKLASVIRGAGSWEQKLLMMGKALQPHIPFDLLGAGLNQVGEISCNAISFLRLGFDEYQAIGVTQLSLITGLSMPALQALKIPAWVPLFLYAIMETILRGRQAGQI